MVRLHQATIEHMSEMEGDLFLMHTVPYHVLHMGNPVGLKLLKTLLNNSLSQTKGGELYSTMKLEEKHINCFLGDIQDYVNKKILSDEDHPTHWHIPYDKQAKMIPPLTLDNTRVRKLSTCWMGSSTCA